jgi:hypothetical protein
MSSGKSTETTVVQPAPRSEEDKRLVEQQLQLGEFRLEELKRQREFQSQFAEELRPLLDLSLEQSQEALAEQRRLAPAREELLQIALEDLRRGGQATPEQIRLIEEAGSAALERGLIDIERFETGGFRTLREELAPGLGLRPSDTPILDRGAMLAAEAERQRGGLAQLIRGGEAAARLQFPLAQSAQTQAGALGQQNLAEATRQFQEQLRAQAFSNRLQAGATVSGLGLGLAGTQSLVLPGQPGGGIATTTTSGGGGLGLAGIGSLAGGVGSLLTGASAAGVFAPAAASGFGGGVTAAGLGALAFSSRELKTDKAPVDEDVVLEKVAELPVESWRYKSGLGLSDERHIGTYAENFREGLGLGDGATLNLIDTTGVTFAAIKALDRKVKRLESGFGFTEHRGLELAA